MFKKIVAFSLNYSSLVIICAGLLLVWTGYSMTQMPVDVFPELSAPTVTIMTEAGGLAADEVEQYVTFPIETSMNGLPGVRRVRSSSATSLSIVWVEFDWGEDITRARQYVSERLTSAKEELPENVHAELGPISSITGEIMLISLTSPDQSVDPLELRAMAEFEIRTRLLAVPNIAQVVAIGGNLPEYTVNVEQNKLRLYDVTLEEIIEAADSSHTTQSAGYLPNIQGLELPLRQTGRVKSVEDIRNTVIKFEHDTPIRIGDVADVKLTGAPRRGAAAEAGVTAVVLSIQKTPGSNTLALTDELDKVLDSIESGLPKGVSLNRHAFRQSEFISASISNVLGKLRDAAIFVAVVLILFLMNARTTLITLVALPLSLAVSLLVMNAMGLTINVMTLGGLAVAIGELVDDAIIYVENVYRRLRQNNALPEKSRRPFIRVVFDACEEIRSSVIFATVIIVIVFVPLLFLEGLEGRFFRPMGIAYITSILASLVIAVTVTPALCKLLLRTKLGKGEEKDTWLVRWLKKFYEPVLTIAIKMRIALIALALLATVASLWLGSTFGASFLPEFNEGTFTVFLMAPPGTSLDTSDRLARGFEKQISQIEGVRSVTRRTGRAERDAHAEPPSNSEIEVIVKQGYDKLEIRQKIDKILSGVAGITTMIGQPIEHRLSHILSGTPAAIAINVFGDDLDKLRAVAKEIETALKDIPGARDVAANRELLVTTLPIRYRADDLARYGLSPEHAANQVSTAFYGTVADTVNDGIRRYDIVVRLTPSQRDTIEDVREFLLHGGTGQLIRLKEIADIGPDQVSNLITRENAQRKATVSCNVKAGYNLGQLVEVVQEKVNPIVQRYGYAVSYGGQFEAQQSASRTIYWMGLGIAIVILLLLDTALGSMKAALLVMINLPLAIIGGIFAIYLSESPGLWTNTLALFGIGETRYIAPVISIASMVGFVTLFGIAVRNGILLVNHYNYLIQNENKSVTEAIMQGSLERLSPILMTALTAMLALAPIVIAGESPGGELLAPLAVVVLGGLITSTFLNLVIVPAGYSLIFKTSGPKVREVERIVL